MIAAVQVSGVSYRYKQRTALRDLSLTIEPGEIFAILGPNGSGKSTLFRLISTLMPPQQGSVHVLGRNVAASPAAIRAEIGVVFQSPSVDPKLTVLENLRQQGYLYGITGRLLVERQQQMLHQSGLSDRAGDRVETLSGGLRRRVELAKGMLHRPRLLLMDEPSAGLDPAARIEMWRHLESIVQQQGVTVVLTTHLLEEADRAHRIAILDDGRLVACDTPENLRQTVGGDSIMIEADSAEQLVQSICDRFAVNVSMINGQVRLEVPDGHHWIAKLVEAFPGQIKAIRLSRPTLEDVFINRTGHQFHGTGNRDQDGDHP